MQSRRGKIPGVQDAASLYEYAIGALGRRMRTVAELKRLLRRRVEDNETGEQLVELTILKLKERKYLNDSRYATIYSENRQANEKFGRRRVIADLKARGVHNTVIEQAVGSAYEDVNEEQLARQYLERKRMRKPANERETARTFRRLVRAGFSTATIFRILKKWDVEDEVLTALASEGQE
jgi:regulatory protein